MLQWTQERQALSDIQKAVPMAWRMNSRQLHSYCENLRKLQPRILPGRIGSEFLVLLDEIADLEDDAKTIIWTKLAQDTEKILRLTEQQQDRQAWLRALSRLQTQQDQFFQTRLGDIFVRTLKEKLGMQVSGLEENHNKDIRKEYANFQNQHGYKEISCPQQQDSKKAGLTERRGRKKMMTSEQQELEEIAAWLMEDTGRTRSHGQRRFGSLMPKRLADMLDRAVIVALACASLCLLAIWLYGQVERNQSFWNAQRMKATAAAQQDGADDHGHGSGTESGTESDTDAVYGDGTGSHNDGTENRTENGNSQDAARKNNQAAGSVNDAGSLLDASVPAGSQGAAAKSRRDSAADAGKRPKILQQYREMAKEYPGLFGWLQIPDTQISLPVMQPLTEQDFYLDHNFTGAESAEGALFVDPKNSRWPQDDNTVIYGHNMKNGHIFGMLNLYEDAEYFETHKEIHFDTIYETGVYEAVAVLKTRILNENEQGFRYYQFFQYENEEEFRQCQNFVDKSKLFDTGKSLQYGDQILMLSTCEYSQENGRLVVVARKK